MTGYQFAWPWLLALAPLPLVIYWLLPPGHSGGGALRVPFYADVAELTGDTRQRGPVARIAAMTLVWLLLLVAAARPQWLGEPGALEISGRDLMLAVDVSNSMRAMDMLYEGIPQDRLEAVKRVAGDFIEGRAGDRLGLVLFGSRAYLQAPLSLDRKTVNQLLQESAIGIAGERTAIGDAIGLALKRVVDRPGTEKLLVLLTDGANTAGEMAPLRAAQLARAGGMRIHAIGVGGDGGGGWFSRGRGDLDEATLQAIAEITGGRYFRATDASTLAEVYRLIDEMEPIPETEDRFRPVVELFFWPLGAALVLTMLSALRQALPSWRREPGNRRLVPGRA